MQVALSLHACCCLKVIKHILGCIHIACSSFMIQTLFSTGLIQVDLIKTLSTCTSFTQVVSTTASNSANYLLKYIKSDSGAPEDQ